MGLNLSGGTIIVGIVIALEMITFNIFSIDATCKRKHNLITTMAVLYFFAAVLITGVYLFIQSAITRFLSGDGIMLLIGWLYVIPCHFLYKENFVHQIITILVSWIYTYSVFSISVGIALHISTQDFLFSALIIQSVIYLIASIFFIRFIKGIFRELINGIEEINVLFLFFVSLINFIVIVLININMVNTNEIYMIFITLLLCVNSFFSVKLFCIVSNTTKNIDSLKNMVYVDYMTNAKNRAALFEDGEKYTKQHKSFSILFLDINGLKRINDVYGHSYGDDYLTLFCSTVKSLLGKNGEIYRISGDEFVCLFFGNNDALDAFVKKVNTDAWDESVSEMKYCGCGIGVVRFPDEGEDFEKLVSLADERMYVNKKHIKTQLY